MKTIDLLAAALFMLSGSIFATTIEPAMQVSSSTDAPGRHVKQEKIPGFTTFDSLPAVVSGIRFNAPREMLSSTAEIDPSLAFVLSTISKSAEQGFTGSGGGMGYLPIDKVALLASPDADSGHAPGLGIVKRKTLTEWRYSTKFDEALRVKLVNVMVRDLKARSNEPEIATTRVYEIAISGNNDALTFAAIQRKQ